MDINKLFAEIDSLPSEKIGFWEHLRLIIRMAKLFKKVRGRGDEGDK